MVNPPQKIDLIGNFLAVKWEEEESFIDFSTLRQNSPSAEQTGEMDIFGRIQGGSKADNHSEVQMKSYDKIGNYGIRPIFSDGHTSGIYSWELLRKLGTINNEKKKT